MKTKSKQNVGNKTNLRRTFGVASAQFRHALRFVLALFGACLGVGLRWFLGLTQFSFDLVLGLLRFGIDPVLVWLWGYLGLF